MIKFPALVITLIVYYSTIIIYDSTSKLLSDRAADGMSSDDDGKSTARLIFSDKYQSPNYDQRSQEIQSIVLHHTVITSLQSVVQHFANPNAKVSSHYVIDKDGSIYRLVDEQFRAWHAGVSSWGGRSSLNGWSIGIEIVNSGDEPFTQQQMQSVAQLSTNIKDRYNIKPQNIVAHGDIAPGRKFDVSGYFDWKTFYQRLNLFPNLYHSSLDDFSKDKILISQTSGAGLIPKLKRDLKTFGYNIDLNSNTYDRQIRNAVQAFNRHFCPEIFVLETVNSQLQMVTNPKNANWYKLSEERLQYLIGLNNL